MGRILSLFLLCGLTTTNTVFANDTDSFLKELAGKYSGKGTARLVGDKADKVVCKIENNFNANKIELVLTGNCASVKGKSSVNGMVAHRDGKISGVLVQGNNSEVTKSHGEFQKGSLILYSTMLDNKVGSVVKVRQEITKTAEGINARFYKFDNKEAQYLKVGELKLKRL